MQLSNIDVKRQNRVNTFRLLLRHERITKPELCAKLGVSLPTVTQNIKDLFDKGLAQHAGEYASTGGRKALAVAPRSNAKVSVGIDITQNHVGFAAVNLCGEVKTHVRIAQKFSHTAAYYDMVADKVLRFIHDCGIEQKTLLGFGISIPGIVSADGKELLDSHLLAVSQTPIDFSARLPAPFRLFNDASAACLAEQWNADSSGEFLFLSLSNSVGGALVVHDEILSGNNQRSGEIGHMCLVPGGKECYCGGIGHYDAYGSALVLSKPAGGRLEDFFEQMDAGNASFKEQFEEYLNHLAGMIVNLRMLGDYNVLLGGYVGGFLSPYLSILQKKVAALDTFQNNAGYLRLCRHKVEASAVGAALFYIDYFIKNV